MSTFQNRKVSISKMRKLVEAAVEGELEEMETILSSRPDEINWKNKYGKAALHYSSYLDFPNAVDLLLTHPFVQVNIKDRHGMTPLMMAAMEGNNRTVIKLLDHNGIKVNENTKYGTTALMYAAKNGHKTVIELLLKHPFIDINALDRWGYTALNWACIKGHHEICNLFKPYQELDLYYNTWIHLFNAALLGDEDFIKKFFKECDEYGAGDMKKLINQGDSKGFTPLHAAAFNGHVNVVRRLLRHPAVDVNRSEAKYGRTPLMLASVFGHLPIVKLLLRHPGINMNKRDSDGRNALTLACYALKTDVAVCLIDEERKNDFKFHQM